MRLYIKLLLKTICVILYKNMYYELNNFFLLLNIYKLLFLLV